MPFAVLQAYLREGVALQQLGHHGDALAAFAAGLAQEPANGHLLSGLTDTALRSPLKGEYTRTNALAHSKKKKTCLKQEWLLAF